MLAGNCDVHHLWVRQFQIVHQLDIVWSPNHVVHRILASAFHGPGPSTEQVVDHIDTRTTASSPRPSWHPATEAGLLLPRQCFKARQIP